MKSIVRLVKIVVSGFGLLVGGVVLTALSAELLISGPHILPLCSASKGLPLSYVVVHKVMYFMCAPSFDLLSFAIDVVFWALVLGYFVYLAKKRFNKHVSPRA